MSKRDYYEVLGVAKGATQEEIKKTFRQQAKKLHPDNKASGDEQAFKELAEAYEVLSDPNRRAQYDHYGHEAVKGAGSRFDQYDFSSFGSMEDILETIFGAAFRAGGPGGRPGGPSQGAHLKWDLDLDFTEAIFGCKKKFKIQRLEDCTTCLGTGAAAGSNVTTCQTCGGIGQVKELVNMLFFQSYQISTCPHCNGNGKKIDKPCRDCKGNGLTRKEKEFEIEIPAGIDDGARMRVQGGGDKGARGGPYGDLIVFLNVKKHKDFIRDGSTIHLKQPISFSMAALGGELLVPTVDGSRILKIPSGIQSGTQLVMKELGVPYFNNPNRRGDQVVHVAVTTPKHLSKEQKELLKRLAELNDEQLTVEEEEKKGVEAKGNKSGGNKQEADESNSGNAKGKPHAAGKEEGSILDKIVDAFRPKED